MAKNWRQAGANVVIFLRVTAVVPDSKALQHALEALPPERKRELLLKRHPWEGLRMLVISGKSWAADDLIRCLVEQFGSCRWSGGRWHVDRAQLSLFPRTAPTNPVA